MWFVLEERRVVKRVKIEEDEDEEIIEIELIIGKILFIGNILLCIVDYIGIVL